MNFGKPHKNVFSLQGMHQDKATRPITGGFSKDVGGPRW